MVNLVWYFKFEMYHYHQYTWTKTMGIDCQLIHHTIKPLFVITSIKQPLVFTGQQFVVLMFIIIAKWQVFKGQYFVIFMFTFIIKWPVLSSHLSSEAILHCPLTGFLTQVWLLYIMSFKQYQDHNELSFNKMIVDVAVVVVYVGGKNVCTFICIVNQMWLSITLTDFS